MWLCDCAPVAVLLCCDRVLHACTVGVPVSAGHHQLPTTHVHSRRHTNKPRGAAASTHGGDGAHSLCAPCGRVTVSTSGALLVSDGVLTLSHCVCVGVCGWVCVGVAVCVWLCCAAETSGCHHCPSQCCSERGMQRTCFTQLKHIIGVHARWLRLRVTQHTPTAATLTGQNGRSASTALMPARGSGAGCRYLTGAWLPMMELLPCMPLPPPPPR